MSQIERFAQVGNDRRENLAFTLGAGESATCYFKASGSDTATAKYFSLGGTAFRVAIYTTQNAQITHIGGHKLKAPLPIAAGWNQFTKGIRWLKITVKSTIANTTFDVLAY